METPKDINGVRTELIMQSINSDMYFDEMPVSEYNQMYMIIYESLKRISKRNILRCMQEFDVGFFDTDIDKPVRHGQPKIG